MKNKLVSIFWGLVLILGGGLFLAENLGYGINVTPIFWIVVFGGVSAMFFATYFLRGLAHWGLLFPASIFGAIALTIGLAEAGFEGNVVGVPILLSVALPFVVAFALNPRKHGWALIPAWVMVMLSGVVLFSDRIAGELVGTLVLWSIGLPFVVVFLMDRSRTWALIPAAVMGVIGLIPSITLILNGNLIGAFVLLVLALPFIGAFLFSHKNWWALIPGGILGSIGLGLLSFGTNVGTVQQDTLMNSLMFLGWAATFGIVWLLRGSYPTAWAKFPAIVFGAIGLALLASGSATQLLWPLMLMAAGVLVLVFNLLPKRA